MSYQNVNTPRFYIDNIQYLKSLGANIIYNEYGTSSTGCCKKLFRDPLSPENPIFLFPNADTYLTNRITFESNSILSKLKEGNGYIALLNHNLVTEGNNETIFYPQFISEDDIQHKPTANEGVNADIEVETDARGFFKPIHDGFSIGTFIADESEVNKFYFTIAKSGLNHNNGDEEFYIGGVSMGNYYDMPFSPDISLTVSIENDGYDQITTKGGSQLSQVRYEGTPMWKGHNDFKKPAWTIGESNSITRRRGRRIWTLKFNYLLNEDLFSSNYTNNDYIESSVGFNSEDLSIEDLSKLEYTISNDNSFISQVLNKIGNGDKFIFQPDKNNSNADQFAICILDQNNLQIKRITKSLYNIKLKIKEVW